ncbi:hypothetical protein WDH52_23085 [Streptomyces sp. TRM70308]|uniref:hypothetical protein n=1 Tax=Streptomyces sp. TRM70308 TaxID=3131932 RepID=UPI003CFE5E05
MAEAGWSGEEFAKKVNAVGIEAGLTLRYGRASVTQWNIGSRPRDPVPRLMAEALSRRLGRKITLATIGFDDSSGCWCEQSLPEQLAELAAAVDSDQYSVSRVAVYHLAALDHVDWYSARVRSIVVERRPWPPLSREELEGATTMVRALAEVDRIYGSGVLKTTASSYLAQMIGIWLRSPAGQELRLSLLTVASRLARLNGFMSFDGEAHGAAQRFYRVSLDLAAESNRPDEYARTLWRMSGQAHYLGHFHSAIHLAESTAELRLPPIEEALILSRIAISRAAAGDREQALRFIGRAEEIAVRQDASRGSQEAGESDECHYGLFVFDKAAMLAHLRDWKGAAESFMESLQYWSLTERRSRAIALSRLAEMQLRQGYLDEAAATWNLFLDFYPSLSSRRLNRAMSIMKSSLSPHVRNRSAAELLYRAAHIAQEGPGDLSVCY